jgi:hypothetical protein
MTPPARQLARVAVDDETWHTFRQAALTRGLSIAAYLAELVERELSRRAGRALDSIAPEQPPAEQALIALADLRLAIDELDLVAGRLARSAMAHGGSWDDIGSSLRLSPSHAQKAYASARAR